MGANNGKTSNPGDAIARIGRALRRYTWDHPQIVALASTFTVREDPKAGTAYVTGQRAITVNPDLIMGVPGAQVFGIMAHEYCHPLFDHFERARDLGLVSSKGKVLKPGPFKIWGLACDMAINAGLRADKIELPEWVVYPPDNYAGDLSAESLYRHLLEEDPEGEETEGAGQSGDGDRPQVGAGCLPEPDQGEGSGDPSPGQGQGTPTEGQGAGQGGGNEPGEWHVHVPTDTEQREAEAMRGMIKAIGSGSSAIARMIEARPSRSDWRKILAGAYSTVSRSNRRDWQSYNRSSRRDPGGEGAIIQPGYVGTEPRIAIAIDCSGSMDRTWIQAIIGEVTRLAGQFPGVRTYLVTHTDRVTWEGWIKAGGDQGKLFQATAFSGGTRVGPAYDAIAKAGRFDQIVHFTDCQVEAPWPKLPARRGVVAAYGSLSYQQAPPPGARVIACTEGAGR